MVRKGKRKHRKQRSLGKSGELEIPRPPRPHQIETDEENINPNIVAQIDYATFGETPL
jgi:hypothetical protein